MNVYIFPLLPGSAYTLTGLVLAEGFWHFYQRLEFKKYLQLIFLTSIILVLSFAWVNNFQVFKIFNSRHVIFGIWHPTVILVTFNLFLMTALVSFLGLIEEKIKRFGLVKNIGLFGQEALKIYFFHVLLGWGIGKYLFPNLKFGLEGPILGVLAFIFLGEIIIALSPKNLDY